jgi:hypothetical protein
MPVLMEDAAEAVPSVDVKSGGGVRFGDGCRQCAQRPGVRDSLMRPVRVVELLEHAQCLQQVRLVPDQGPVEQLATAGLHPSLHDRVAPHRQLHPIRMIDTGLSG